jgi:hypothetical protein
MSLSRQVNHLAIEVDPKALPCRMPQCSDEVPVLDVADYPVPSNLIGTLMFSP